MPSSGTATPATRPRELHRDRRRLALDVGGHEIERAIRDDRTAEAAAPGVPHQADRRIAERVVGGEVVVAQEIGERAVPLVAARLRDDVDEAAVGAAGLRAEPAGADLELLDGLERDA